MRRETISILEIAAASVVLAAAVQISRSRCVSSPQNRALGLDPSPLLDDLKLIENEKAKCKSAFINSVAAAFIIGTTVSVIAVVLNVYLNSAFDMFLKGTEAAGSDKSVLGPLTGFALAALALIVPLCSAGLALGYWIHTAAIKKLDTLKA